LGRNLYIMSQYWDVMYTLLEFSVIFSYSVDSSLGRVPARVAPPPQTTAIFRDFKKSTAMCKVHNVGLRYINTSMLLQKS